MTTKIWATPVFAGKTSDDEKIVLYTERGREEMGPLHIRQDDGELWALSLGSELVHYIDKTTDTHHLTIESPEWSGTAEGSWLDVINEPSLYR